jgi:isocitrate dehydrogenase
LRIFYFDGPTLAKLAITIIFKEREKMAKIIWSEIDEAPALATYAFLPIVQAFCKGTGVDVETKDISLSGRVIANFPEKLTEEQKIPDYLAELGEIVLTPEANVIKLPNISASIPQLQDCIKELQEKGYDIPSYPEEANTAEEKELQARFAKCLGSAVNPVLREGNSDRRAAASVKKFAQKNPHRMMQDWPAPGTSKCRVAHMDGGDFYETEKSVTMDKADTVKIQFVDQAGKLEVKKEVALQAGEVFDSSVMKVAKLQEFYAKTAQEIRSCSVTASRFTSRMRLRSTLRP